MPRETHELTRDDIMDMAEYAKERKERRAQVSAAKQNRRVHIGPDATAYFESYETMWHQVHEMLHIEQGGEEQIEDELRAYNPLIPKGRELVATLMIEIPDKARREKFLAKLGGFEETVKLEFDGETIEAEAEDDVDRTTADGKASSIQFLHFPMTDAQAEKFKTEGTKAELSINHDQYSHVARIPEEVRATLARDLD